jgi:hypothetical protein
LIIHFLFHKKKLWTPALTVPASSHLISHTLTKCNLYFANSLAIVVSEPDLYRLLTYQGPNMDSFFHCLVLIRVWVQVPRHSFMFRKKEGFYCEEFSAPRPEDHPFSAVGEWLFKYIRSYPTSWMPFLHQQREDAPCRGDRNPLIMGLWRTSWYNGQVAYVVN